MEPKGLLIGRNWGLISTFFDQREIKFLRSRIEEMPVRQIVYCSFENRLAKSGGLGAVVTSLLPHLNRLPGIERVVLLTPFHACISDLSRVVSTGNRFPILFEGRKIEVEILTSSPSFRMAPGVEEYYLASDGFFQAENRIADPYLHDPDNAERNRYLLRRDALFYCATAPQAASRLGLDSETIFHLQEWQTSLLTLTLKQALLEGKLQSVGCVQTLHNPYDDFIPLPELKEILDIGQWEKCRDRVAANGYTALQIGLQLVDGPVTTVSDTFAREMTTDIIQTGYFAPHLQGILRSHPPVGIANGRFIDFPPALPANSANDIGKITAFKEQYRAELLEVLSGYRPASRFGALTWRNRSIRGLPGNIPILVMSGRLDWNQKGFDILIRSLARFAKDEIKIVLAPLPQTESDMVPFRAVATARRGDITVFPMRMSRGYQELLRGATFGLMPSIYEPFGAAVEYMVNGTPTLARRCGGLADQVIDGETGLLFRETDEYYRREHIDRYMTEREIDARATNPWATSMVDALAQGISRGMDLFQNHHDRYLEMIGRGLVQATRFDWGESALRYLDAYRAVGGRSV